MKLPVQSAILAGIAALAAAVPPFSNPFKVIALQPDGSSVTRTVRIQ